MLTPEIYEDRFKSIGGSEIAAALGVSKYMSPFELWNYKVHRVRDEMDAEFALIRSEMEAVVAKAYEHRTGESVFKREKIIRNDEYPWLHANVDRMIKNKNAVLECKTAHWRMGEHYGEEYTCDIPREYILQCALYCLVLGCEYADIAVLIGGNDLKVYRYDRNQDLEMQIVTQSRDFWYNHVVTGKPPALTEQDDLDRLFRTVEGTKIEAPESMRELALEYRELNNKVTEATKRKDIIKKTLKLFLGEKETMTYNDVPIVTNKASSRKNVPVESLKKAYPGIYNELVKTTEHKRLLIKKGIDDE